MAEYLKALKSLLFTNLWTVIIANKYLINIFHKSVYCRPYLMLLFKASSSGAQLNRRGSDKISNPDAFRVSSITFVTTSCQP